jgi:hypothetical protein
MPEMMKHKASTAASVLMTLIERRSADFCVRCLRGAVMNVAFCRMAGSGTSETLPGKTNERGTSSSGKACNKAVVSRKSDSLLWHCWQVDR